jgi:hypothetical protein
LLERGTIVAGYRIDGVLGEGGMGTVYRATQLSLNRVVALKLLAGALSDDQGFRARFQREGQLQAGLDHRHIVTVYEAGQSDHGLFLAMRLIAGPTLKDLILDGQLDSRRALRVLAQVAQALDAAHEAGLIHRDIKPQNILVDKGDHVFLADFGLIKAPDDAASLTGTGQFIGTIDYVAPEQIQGEPATAASDSYALAGVLYECLTGEVPFPRNNEAATIHAHIVDPRPTVTDKRPDLPAAIDEVIASGMARDPAARPASATDLIRLATTALSSSSEPIRTAPGAQETRLSRPEGLQTTRVPPMTPAGGAPITVRGPAAVTRPAAEPEVAAAPAAAPPAARPQRAATGLWIVVAVLAAAAIAAGYLVGHGSSGSTASAFTNSATVGTLQLRYPTKWQLGPTLPAIPGMTFSEPLKLGPAPAVGGLSAGEVTDGSGPTLLSPSFRARVQGGVPRGEPVQLGSVAGYRYSGLRVRGLSGSLTVYAVPTTAGVATIACWNAGPAGQAVDTQCQQVAGTLRLIGVTPYSLGPNASYAHSVSDAFGRLGTTVGSGLTALRTAGTPGAQAKAAQQVAAGYSAAASDLGKVTVPPAERDAHAAIVGALRRLADAYGSAAAAAAASNSGAYTRARGQITAASDALGKALRGLAALGYKVPG